MAAYGPASGKNATLLHWLSSRASNCSRPDIRWGEGEEPRPPDTGTPLMDSGGRDRETRRRFMAGRSNEQGLTLTAVWAVETAVRLTTRTSPTTVRDRRRHGHHGRAALSRPHPDHDGRAASAMGADIVHRLHGVGQAGVQAPDGGRSVRRRTDHLAIAERIAGEAADLGDGTNARLRGDRGVAGGAASPHPSTSAREWRTA